MEPPYVNMNKGTSKNSSFVHRILGFCRGNMYNMSSHLRGGMCIPLREAVCSSLRWAVHGSLRYIVHSPLEGLLSSAWEGLHSVPAVPLRGAACSPFEGDEQSMQSPWKCCMKPLPANMNKDASGNLHHLYTGLCKGNMYTICIPLEKSCTVILQEVCTVLFREVVCNLCSFLNCDACSIDHNMLI